MGVNNNNDFRLSAGINGQLALQLVAPTNRAIPCVAIATNITQLLFGGALPLSPLTAPVVYGTPSGNPDDACFVSTNASLAGKIVLLDRGSTNCNSADIAQQAQSAGAVAVLETTPGDAGYPFRLGDANPDINIPVLAIAENYGGGLLKSYLTNHIPITAIIQGDANPRVAEWNGPKGFGNVDVLTSFAVPAPGLYPLRLVSGHKGGNGNVGADLEWFSIMPDGTRILINDTSNPNALVAFRARNAGVVPVMNAPKVSGATVTLSWTGVGQLEESLSAAGPWYPSANQNNPQTVPASGKMRLYRLRHF
jgi:PA domain-containing protein